MAELFLHWLQSLMDFSTILNVSIAASWMVLAVLILRFVLKKSPKWVYVALWGMVAIRLLMPFSIESAFSLIPSVQTIPQEILRYQGTQLSQPAYVDIITNPNYFGDISIQLNQSVDRMQWRMVYMTFIWLCGIAIMLLYALISYLLLHRKVATAVRYKDNIFQSENIASPFVLGILKPRIYLPFKISEKDAVHVIAHENAHILRKDHWWKPLGFVLLAIHWFNPLMWLAYIILCRDIELACDEKVIRNLGNQQKADYSMALVTCSVSHRMIAACPLAFGEIGVKDRVKSVMNYKKPVLWVSALSLICCIAVAVCFLTNPERNKYSIRITVPAGSTHQFVYSDEEIRALGNKITITSGDNLPDTEVILKAVSGTAETGYVAEYITHGLPVEFDADKNLWVKVGINIQNPTDQDKTFYVNVKNVEVRIAEESNELSETVPISIEGFDSGKTIQLTASEDMTVISDIISSAQWVEGTTDCMSDFKITVGDNEYYYHLSCGTINDNKNNRNMTLNEEQRNTVEQMMWDNNLLYVTHYPANKGMYLATPQWQTDYLWEKEEFIITKSHFLSVSDEWVCGDYKYKYRLKITGKRAMDAHNTTYVVLSNTENISFDQVWKASGFSSNMADYFDPADAVIVGFRLFS